VGCGTLTCSKRSWKTTLSRCPIYQYIERNICKFRRNRLLVLRCAREVCVAFVCQHDSRRCRTIAGPCRARRPNSIRARTVGGQMLAMLIDRLARTSRSPAFGAWFTQKRRRRSAASAELEGHTDAKWSLHCLSSALQRVLCTMAQSIPVTVHLFCHAFRLNRYCAERAFLCHAASASILLV
jgi:hypothetical protein